VSRLSILILTEDGSADAFHTIKALLEKTLFLVHATHDPARIDFEPATEEARTAMRANAYKSRKPRDYYKRVDLIKLIATRLLRDNSFVVVHVDGDRVYSESRDGTDSENINAFREHIECGVKDFLNGRQAQERHRRLLLMVPFYSVESWLYQNVEEALRIYQEVFPGHTSDADLFSRWRNDRLLLDEVDKPKERVAIGAKHNLRLARTSFPASAVFGVGKSYTKAVVLLRNCDDLVRSLATLRHGC
jgi:hypothetical protein